MRKYLVGVLLCVFGVLAAIYFFVGVPNVYETNLSLSAIPHIYGDPARSIERIHVLVWYVVPRDHTESRSENWKEVVKENLEKLQTFHENQFQGRSHITYEISPEPIFSSQQGFLVFQELQNMGFVFRNDAPDEYRVFLVVYEGDEKATGSEKDSVLIARSLITDESYRSFHATFFAHEFYHALGIPDRYGESAKVLLDGREEVVGILSSGDLMGRVRVPIEQTYLARETLQSMGL